MTDNQQANVNSELFTILGQRFDTAYKAIEGTERRCVDRRTFLQAEINRVAARLEAVEERRATDRRMMIRASIAAAATIAATIIGFILNLILEGGIL